LRDDGGTDSHQRTRHAGAEAQLAGYLRDRADHIPNERAVALIVNPRMEVIRDERELEAGGLGRLRVAD